MVSVVVICYNQASYIRECLDSILMQKTTFPFEVKVYDDASTDGTADILREYGRKHKNLELNLYKENNFAKGLAYYGEKQGYMTARGKYIATCEGDDYWTNPLKLQKQVEFLESHPDYSVVFHRYKIYQEQQRLWYSDGMDDLFVGDDQCVELTTELFLNRWLTQYVTMMFRREAYRSNKIDRYKLFRDSHLYYSLLQEGKGALLPMIAGVYRRTGKGIYTHMQEVTKLESHIAVAKEMWELNSDMRLKYPYVKAMQYFIDCLATDRVYTREMLQYAWTILKLTGRIKNFVKNCYKIWC